MLSFGRDLVDGVAGAGLIERGDDAGFVGAILLKGSIIAVLATAL